MGKAITVTTTFGEITPEMIERLPESLQRVLAEIVWKRLEQILQEEADTLQQAA